MRTSRTKPPAQMAAAVRQAQAELIAHRLQAALGGPIAAGTHALAAALIARKPSPADPVERILAEAKRTGRRPSVIAKSIHRTTI